MILIQLAFSDLTERALAMSDAQLNRQDDLFIQNVVELTSLELKCKESPLESVKLIPPTITPLPKGFPGLLMFTTCLLSRAGTLLRLPREWKLFVRQVPVLERL
jgi:hypothetical protein